MSHAMINLHLKMQKTNKTKDTIGWNFSDWVEESSLLFGIFNFYGEEWERIRWGFSERSLHQLSVHSKHQS